MGIYLKYIHLLCFYENLFKIYIHIYIYCAFMSIYFKYCRSASQFIYLKAPCSSDGEATNMWDGRSGVTFPVGAIHPSLVCQLQNSSPYRR